MHPSRSSLHGTTAPSNCSCSDAFHASEQEQFHGAISWSRNSFKCKEMHGTTNSRLCSCLVRRTIRTATLWIAWTPANYWKKTAQLRLGRSIGNIRTDRTVDYPFTVFPAFPLENLAGATCSRSFPIKNRKFVPLCNKAKRLCRRSPCLRVEDIVPLAFR